MGGSIFTNNNLGLKNDKTFKIILFLGFIIIGSLVFSSTASATPINTTTQIKYQHYYNTGQSQYAGPSTNITKWTYKTGNSIKSSPAVGSDGTVYVVSFNNYTYAINPNGQFKWKYKTSYTIYSSPTIGSDGTVYVGGDCLYALNPNGTLKWKYSTIGNIQSSSPMIGSDNTIYIGGTDGDLYAIKNGQLKWKYQTGGIIQASSPVIGSNGTIYIGVSDGNLYAINPNGTLSWKFKTDNMIYASPAIGSDGTIYIGSFDKYLYAINPDGTLKWKFKTEGYLDSVRPAVGNDGTIYLETEDNCIYAINNNGTLKWTYQTGININSPLVGYDGTVYVGNYPGNLFAINNNGTLKWVYNTGSTIGYIPVIGNDGTLYVGNYAGYMYAINDVNITASLQSGIYNVNKRVNIITNVPSSIYYKIYNSTNNTSWKKYTSTLTINRSCDIAFYAVYSNVDRSYIISKKYIIDKITPKVIPSKKAVKVLLNENIRVKFSENIYGSTNINKIYLKNLKTGKLVKLTEFTKGNVLIIKHSVLSKNTTYRLYIPKSSFKDQVGNQITIAYTTKFKTVS